MSFSSRAMSGAVLGVLLAVAPAGAAPLRSGQITVSGTGEVLRGSDKLGTLGLPPPPRTLRVREPTVRGHRLLHVVVRGKDGRKAELLAHAGSREVLFNGRTGPRGVDGEWSQHLEVDATGVLVFQRREGVERCDGEPIHLFPRMYDFGSRRLRPVARPPRSGGLPRVVATRARPAELAARPMNTFRLAFASSMPGDGGQALGLGAPSAADDGDPATAWHESEGGAGQGVFLTARAQLSTYRLRALSIIPGDASSPRAFRQANRLRELVLALAPGKRYRVVFPRDPLRDGGQPGEPYWVVLPEPVATTCVTVVIGAVYPGADARRSPGGGRTAISELRLFTDLETGDGQKKLLADLRAGDEDRARHAVRVLASLGARGVELVAPLISSATGALQQRVLRVLARSRRPESAEPLARLLPRLPARLHGVALEALVRLGPPATAVLAPLLASRTQDAALAGRVALALGRLGGDAAWTTLLARAGAGPEALRSQVAEALSRLPPARRLSALLTAARDAKEPERRADLIVAATRMAGRAPADRQRAAAGRIAALWPGASAFEPRYRILQAVGRLDAAGQLSLLRRAARGDDPILRWVAVERIRRAPGAEARAALLRALADADPRVRAAAAQGLARLPASRPVSRALARQLRRERWPLAARPLVSGLGRHCSARGNAALRHAVRRGPRGVDGLALQSLVRCRPPGIVDELLAVARGRGWRAALRRAAIRLIPAAALREREADLARLLSRLRQDAATRQDEVGVALTLIARLGQASGSPSAAALTDTLALDPHEELRAAAARALGRRCPPSAVPTLRRAAGDASPVVRRQARQALERCK